MRFLHAADLHLDSPLRGLDRQQGAPVERLRSATRAALERLVDKALEERVDLLLLAGDIYDRDWRDFHTGLYFRDQMVRLQQAGILVFLVQGNHDAQGVISRTLPLPENVTRFSSRRAETVQLDPLGVAIHGRSFPERVVTEDLVPSYPAPVAGLFNIGLLHTSLSGRPGHDTYAPTDLATLSACGYDYWALGHVHTREVVSEQHPRVVYPGNLQGRHANETGAKGAELVSVTEGRLESEFVPLDVVRWHRLELDLTDVERIEQLPRCLHEHLAPLLASAGDQLHAIRIQLSGRSPLYRLEAKQPGRLAADLHMAAQDLTQAEIWIEQVHNHLRPPVERVAARERGDAIGELLRLTDSLAADDERLLQWARSELGGLLDRLPPEVSAGDTPRLDEVESLRQLLREAEATVLARLGVA